MECFERPRSEATVALGDSLTMGSSDPAWGFQADDSWFSLVTCDGSPRYGSNAGVGGETTADMRRRLDSVLGAKPELVIILAGTNDLLQHRPIEEAAADLTAMVEAIEASGAKVVVGTIPPLKGLPVEEWNDRLRSLRRPIIDFHRAVTDGSAYRKGFGIGDGIHPSKAGVRAMAEEATRTLATL